MAELLISIKGMDCANCSAKIERKLNQLAGVKAEVNLATEKANVSFDPAQNSAESLIQSIEKAGYGAVIEEMSLDITGMTCANCSSRIERKLSKLDGMLSANVNLATEKATVRFLPDMLSLTDISHSVEQSGYGLKLPTTAHSKNAQMDPLKRDTLIALSLTLPLFLGEMLPMLIPGGMTLKHSLIPHQLWLYLSFILATLVQFGPGWRFYKSGLPSLLSGSPDMNSLVMLGSSAAYLYSVTAAFLPHFFPAGTRHLW
ncbi:MAG: copper ion binding protein [Deinococcales bacterium]